jgi:hypothetical protein
MDRRTVFIVVVSAIAVLLAIAAVSAHTQTTNTPLYTVRMEQASSKMNFLPTKVNEFTYITQKGFTLNHDVTGEFCGANPLTGPGTCGETCPETICGSTCETCPQHTCSATCPYTCDDPTCPYTCDDPTCSATCPYTCSATCPATCNPTCDEYTCSGYKCP